MEEKKLAIKLRKFNRLCPIKGQKDDSIKIGAQVVVLTNRGLEYGEIVSFPNKYPNMQSEDVRLKKVLRYATREDKEQAAELDQLEKQAVMGGYQRVKEYELAIKIVNAEYLFDRKKVHIYYKLLNDKKVPDLKDLRKTLSTDLKAEVLLRSVTPRDVAKFLGGLGPCGFPLCCHVWLEKPRHITVKMVKDQGVQISPSKTSGMCGRLMCCFEYESKQCPNTSCPKKEGGEK